MLSTRETYIYDIQFTHSYCLSGCSGFRHTGQTRCEWKLLHSLYTLDPLAVQFCRVVVTRNEPFFAETDRHWRGLCCMAEIRLACYRGVCSVRFPSVSAIESCPPWSMEIVIGPGSVSGQQHNRYRHLHYRRQTIVS